GGLDCRQRRVREIGAGQDTAARSSAPNDQYGTMSMPDHTVDDAAEKGICSAGLAVAAHDNQISPPLFGSVQDQSLGRSVVHDQLEFLAGPAGNLANPRRRRFGNLLLLQWKLQCGDPAD